MPDNRLRFGIIGTGGRGLGSFARGLRNDFPDQADIVALSDMDTVRLAVGAKHFEVDRTDTDPSVVLDNPDVDVVVITTTDATHAGLPAPRSKPASTSFAKSPSPPPLRTATASATSRAAPQAAS